MINDKTPSNVNKYQVTPIGIIRRQDKGTFIELLAEYKPALKELERWSHVQILWWFSQFDDDESRKVIQFDKVPYEAPPLGVFACRSPLRPNPIGLTTAKLLAVDHENGIVQIGDIDAFDGTPVLDMKAYIPSMDRVKTVRVPEWAAEWPEWVPEEGIGLEDY
jgi:tRNA-Thr(GGU) m(6)t(6)A37 methyltransferase TsaA